jgi:hypothetical protein
MSSIPFPSPTVGMALCCMVLGPRAESHPALPARSLCGEGGRCMPSMRAAMAADRVKTKVSRVLSWG